MIHIITAEERAKVREALSDLHDFLQRHSNRWDGANGQHPFVVDGSATEAIAILDKTPEVEVVGHSEEKPCTNCVSWNCELHGKPDNAPCLPRPLYAIKETK